VLGQITDARPRPGPRLGRRDSVLDAGDTAASLTDDTGDDIVSAQKTVALLPGQLRRRRSRRRHPRPDRLGRQAQGRQGQVTSLRPGHGAPTEKTSVPRRHRQGVADAGHRRRRRRGHPAARLLQGQVRRRGRRQRPARHHRVGRQAQGRPGQPRRSSPAAVTDNTAAIQAQNDLLKQQLDLANRRANIAEANRLLGRAFLDWMSGELGGRIGPGFQTPPPPASREVLDGRSYVSRSTRPARTPATSRWTSSTATTSCSLERRGPTPSSTRSTRRASTPTATRSSSSATATPRRRSSCASTHDLPGAADRDLRPAAEGRQDQARGRHDQAHRPVRARPRCSRSSDARHPGVRQQPRSSSSATPSPSPFEALPGWLGAEQSSPCTPRPRCRSTCSPRPRSRAT
jgi:hypothetical protein